MALILSKYSFIACSANLEWDNIRLAHHHCNSIKKDSIVNEGETG